jgi:hypothetical protein
MKFYVYGFEKSAHFVRLAAFFSQYGTVTALKLHYGEETTLAVVAMDDREAKWVIEELDGMRWLKHQLRAVRSPLGEPE